MSKKSIIVGQVATAQVVMNRVADDRYPNTVCEVVKQVQHVLLGEDPARRNIQLDTDANSVGIAMVNLMFLRMRKHGEKHKMLHF